MPYPYTNSERESFNKRMAAVDRSIVVTQAQLNRIDKMNEYDSENNRFVISMEELAKILKVDTFDTPEPYSLIIPE